MGVVSHVSRPDARLVSSMWAKGATIVWAKRAKRANVSRSGGVAVPSRRGLVTLVVLILAAGCGSANDDPAAAAAGQAELTVASPSADGEDPSNPWNLAWIVSGAPGLEFETAEELTVNGAVQIQSGRRTLDGTGAFSWLYTQFVDEVGVEVTVISGGPATVSLVIARFLDAQAAAGELEVKQVLETAELGDGESIALSGTR